MIKTIGKKEIYRICEEHKKQLLSDLRPFISMFEDINVLQSPKIIIDRSDCEYCNI